MLDTSSRLPVGPLLREWRLSRRLTQQELAERAAAVTVGVTSLETTWFNPRRAFETRHPAVVRAAYHRVSARHNVASCKDSLDTDRRRGDGRSITAWMEYSAWLIQAQDRRTQ